MKRKPTFGELSLGESSMGVSLSAGLLLAEDFEQAAIRSGYRDDPFSHACASRIFSSMEKRCRFSSRGTCTSQMSGQRQSHTSALRHVGVTRPAQAGCRVSR